MALTNGDKYQNLLDAEDRAHRRRLAAERQARKRERDRERSAAERDTSVTPSVTDRDSHAKSRPIAVALPVAEALEKPPVVPLGGTRADSEKPKRKRKSKPQATGWPDGWTFGNAEYEAARKRGAPSRESAQAAFDSFRDHAEANGRQQVGWPAAWRTWCQSRRDKKFDQGWPQTSSASPLKSKRAAESADTIARMKAANERNERL